MAIDLEFFKLPFFETSHYKLANELVEWSENNLKNINDNEIDATCRDLVTRYANAGWLRYCVPSGDDDQYGGIFKTLDVRSISIIRHVFASYHALADFSFGMQGLGSGAIALEGSQQLKNKYLSRVVQGEAIAAFALSEPDAGSDVAALSCTATEEGDYYLLNGYKKWISNAGIADFYCVFAKTDESAGARGISAFVVDANTEGLYLEERLDIMSPHPIGVLRFENCKVKKDQLLGQINQGFKLAMRTLDIFRTSVAAAALGLAERAYQESLLYSKQRQIFQQALADFQMTQAAIGDMATYLDRSKLLTYRSAWLYDQGINNSTETAMAKMTATEDAQWIIDRSLQMFGGLGVVKGSVPERLYRDIRALRIYEGATEVQKLIVSRNQFRKFIQD